MSLLERLEVPAAKSRFSISATERPRLAASSAMPQPVTPPPTTSTSKSSTPSRSSWRPRASQGDRQRQACPASRLLISRSSPHGLGMYQSSGMYHDRCAILCQDSDRPGGASDARPQPRARRRLAPRESSMRHIAEAARTTPVMHETEVLVVGGGPGGLAAALAAARAGAHDHPRRPLRLLRRRHHPGRRRHHRLVPARGDRRPRGHRHRVRAPRRGDGRHGAGRPVPQPGAGLRALQGRRRPARRRRPASSRSSTASSPSPSSRAGCVKGVVTESKSGRQAILARARGGRHRRRRPGLPRRRALPHAPARLGDGRHRHVLVLRRGQGALPRPRRRERAHLRRLGQVLERQDGGQGGPPLQPVPAGAVRPGPRATASSPRRSAASAAPGAAITDAGEATSLNMVVMAGYDCTDVRDLTRAEIEGRRQALLAIEALRRYTPGFENARLRTFGVHAGDARLAQDHRPLRADRRRTCAARRGSTTRSASSPSSWTATASWSSRPPAATSRCPTASSCPREVDDLLVAGRCVAGDKISHAATRNQMCCAVTGRPPGRPPRSRSGTAAPRRGGRRAASRRSCDARARGWTDGRRGFAGRPGSTAPRPPRGR